MRSTHTSAHLQTIHTSLLSCLLRKDMKYQLPSIPSNVWNANRKWTFAWEATCVALSIFCLNIALLCSPLNAFETWADQQELSKEARYKSAFSTRRRVSLLESSMLLKKPDGSTEPEKLQRLLTALSEHRPICCAVLHSKNAPKEDRCLFCNWLPNSLPSLRYTVPHIVFYRTLNMYG